jgi:hypothetical protein
VNGRGKDLPLGMNLSITLMSTEECNNTFLWRPQDFFPNTWVLSQWELACCVVLGVRNYEWLAMLASILKVIYIDPKWVAKEYLL